MLSRDWELNTQFFMMLEARNIFASGFHGILMWRDWNANVFGGYCFEWILISSSGSLILNPSSSLSAFPGMDDVHFLIPSWRNSLCGVQTDLRQIHDTLWSPLKEEARATTFNLLLLQYKLGLSTSTFILSRQIPSNEMNPITQWHLFYCIHTCEQR